MRRGMSAIIVKDNKVSVGIIIDRDLAIKTTVSKKIRKLAVSENSKSAGLITSANLINQLVK